MKRSVAMSIRFHSRAVTLAGRRERGGTLVGLLIGVVLGLAIAVATAMFVTRASVPFIGGDQAKERLSMPSDKPPPPVSPVDSVDAVVAS